MSDQVASGLFGPVDEEFHFALGKCKGKKRHVPG